LISYRFYTRRLHDQRFTLSLESTYEHRSAFHQAVCKYLTGTDYTWSHEPRHYILLNTCQKDGIVETVSFEGNQLIEHAAYGDNRHYGKPPWKRLFCSACHRYWYLEERTYIEVKAIYLCPVCALGASITETSSAPPATDEGKLNEHAKEIVTYPLGTHIARIDVSQQLVLLAGTQASVSLPFEEVHSLLDLLYQYRQHFYEAVYDDALPSDKEMQAIRCAEIE
jgi:hypothetical protein